MNKNDVFKVLQYLEDNDLLAPNIDTLHKEKVAKDCMNYLNRFGESNIAGAIDHIKKERETIFKHQKR